MSTWRHVKSFVVFDTSLHFILNHVRHLSNFILRRSFCIRSNLQQYHSLNIKIELSVCVVKITNDLERNCIIPVRTKGPALFQMTMFKYHWLYPTCTHPCLDLTQINETRPKFACLSADGLLFLRAPPIPALRVR